MRPLLLYLSGDAFWHQFGFQGMSAIAALPRDVFQLDRLIRFSRRLHASVMAVVIFLQGTHLPTGGARISNWTLTRHGC